MHYFGIFLGWILVAGFVFETLKYFVNTINQKKIVMGPKDSHQRENYTALMWLIIKPHPYIPLYLITVLLMHFMIEVIHKGLLIMGVLAACLMIAQVALGTYGTLVKNREEGIWFYAHRTIAILLFFTIIWHIVSVWGLPPD